MFYCASHLTCEGKHKINANGFHRFNLLAFVDKKYKANDHFRGTFRMAKYRLIKKQSEGSDLPRDFLAI